MDCGDLWKVIPSIPSPATFSNDTVILSTALSTQESKQDLFAQLGGNKKENEGIRKNIGRTSQIWSLSPNYQKLYHDNSHRPLESNTQCGSEKKLRDRMNKKISKENMRSQIYNDISNASNAPFIELGAVCKVLDFVTDSDPKVSSLTNNCCNEILRTLRCLLTQRHDKKLEDLLLNDSSLYRCERCGVISYTVGSHPATEDIKGNRTKPRRDAAITTAERDCINNDRDNERSEISVRLSDLRNNVQSSINDPKVDRRTKYKDELDGTSNLESLPIKERAFVMRSCIESSNRANNISNTKADVSAKIKNKFLFNNNIIKRLFMNFETAKRDEKYGDNSVARNNHSGKREFSIATKAHVDIDEEEIVRKISYEPKSQIDDFLAGDRSSKTARNIRDLRGSVDKRGDIYPVVDTVKYLARGQFTTLDEQEDELVAKLREGRHARLEDARNGRSSVLYGSRDDYPQRDSGFWLFDESGRLPEIVLDEYRYLPMPRMVSNGENARFPNVSRHSRTGEMTRQMNSRSDYMEKDSLEDCALLEQRRESDTTIFSSSSAENLIREWMGSLDRKDEINDEYIPRGRRLVSSRPSLDIARHVRAQIAKDKRSDNAKKPMRELRTRDLVRLSPETRRKISRLVKKMILSDSIKDLAFWHRDENSTIDVLNTEKLLHSKSATSVDFNKYIKIDNEVKDLCIGDCVPSRLSELPEGKNHLLKRQDNFVNICNQDTNKSKISIKIPHKNAIASVLPDKSVNDSTRKIARRVIYKDASSKNTIGNDDRHTMAEILSVYRKILEDSGDMNWDKFRELVETLHPDQRELWRDVCRTIGEEAKRVADDADGNTEVCIEISPVNPEGTPKTSKVMACAREIVFELDMTLKDVESFLDKRPRLVKERLDTHSNGSRVADEDVSSFEGNF